MEEKTKPKQELYKVTLETSGKVIVKEGKTIEEAIEKMGLEWHDIKAKGTLEVSLGKKTYKREVPFSVVQLRRFFGSKDVRALWSSRFKYFLDNS